MPGTGQRELGMGRGKIYPAKHARQLRNPLRNIFQSPRRLVGNLDIAPGATVLELGCGPGFFSPTLAARVPQGRLLLFDFQRVMLELARERLAREDIANFSCVQGDGMALPYADGTCDLALMVTVLGEVPDPVACLHELRRVLKPGGQLAVSEGRNDSDFHRLSAVQELAASAGFTFVRSHGPSWNYTAIFENPARG